MTTYGTLFHERLMQSVTSFSVFRVGMCLAQFDMPQVMSSFFKPYTFRLTLALFFKTAKKSSSFCSPSDSGSTSSPSSSVSSSFPLSASPPSVSSSVSSSSVISCLCLARLRAAKNSILVKRKRESMLVSSSAFSLQPSGSQPPISCLKQINKHGRHLRRVPGWNGASTLFVGRKYTYLLTLPQAFRASSIITK